MAKKLTVSRKQPQASLKLEDQKLLKIDFDGGLLSNFGGLPLVTQLAQASGLISGAAGCIEEWRKGPVKFGIEELLSQRLHLIVGGEPDAIDCTVHQDDPGLKVVLGKEPDGDSLASQSSHTRMEQNVTEASCGQLEGYFLEFFLSQHEHAPQSLTLIGDSTAIRTYGKQQSSTFRGGKYNQTQYYPVIVTTDTGELLVNELRPGGASDAHAAKQVQNLVLDIKRRWSRTKLTVRLDTGFNNPDLLAFLEEEGVDYEIGYPASTSIHSKCKDVEKEVEQEFRKKFGKPKFLTAKGKKDKKKWQKEHERIRDLPVKERMGAEAEQAERRVRRIIRLSHNGTGWHGQEREVVVRIDYDDSGLDVRCVVTSNKHGTPEQIYEEGYCQRSQVEGSVKENKSHCRVPLSAQEFKANRFRFILQGLAYTMLHLLRLALSPERAKVSIASIRKNLILIPVLIESTARRVYWHLSSTYRDQTYFLRLVKKLQGAA